MAPQDAETNHSTQLVPVLPLTDICLFPGASLTLVIDQAVAVNTVALAERSGGPLLAVARRESAIGPKDLHPVGTLARVAQRQVISPLEQRVELDGLERARVEQVVGSADVLVAEVRVLTDGDEGEEWGAAVEALARYLHAHPELRGFLEAQRRASEPMGWVNLACQHLPITASARQRLLEANAATRCTKISRGLDALLRKEQGT